MTLQLCVDWRVFVYLSNKTNFTQNKFVDGKLRGFLDFRHFWGSKGNIKFLNFFKTKNHISFSRIL